MNRWLFPGVLAALALPSAARAQEPSCGDGAYLVVRATHDFGRMARSDIEGRQRVLICMAALDGPFYKLGDIRGESALHGCPADLRAGEFGDQPRIRSRTRPDGSLEITAASNRIRGCSALFILPAIQGPREPARASSARDGVADIVVGTGTGQQLIVSTTTLAELRGRAGSGELTATVARDGRLARLLRARQTHPVLDVEIATSAGTGGVRARLVGVTVRSQRAASSGNDVAMESISLTYQRIDW